MARKKIPFSLSEIDDKMRDSGINSFNPCSPHPFIFKDQGLREKYWMVGGRKIGRLVGRLVGR